MKPVFHLDMSAYPKEEPKAMLEMIGGWLLANLNEQYPASKGYAVHHVKRDGASPFATRWDIYLTRGHFWRFKLSLEVFQMNKKTYFHISIGRNLDWSGACTMLGMVISLISLLIAFIDPGETFNTNIILPLLIGTLIGSFALSLPIRRVIQPYIIMKARNEGIEEGENQLIEEIKTALRRAGQAIT